MWKLFAFAILIAAGQLLFKRTAQGVTNVNGFEAIIRQILVDPWFIIAMTMYMAATILWILALREIPLSRAYPFMALAFVLVPAGAVVCYGETLDARYFIGLALVIAGMALTASSAMAPRDVLVSSTR